MAKDVIDNSLDLKTREGIRRQLELIFAQRAEAGQKPRGDIEVLEPNMVEYTDEGELIVEIPVKEWQVNGFDIVQGGVLAYMMDVVCGPMSFVLSGCTGVSTTDLTTNYLRPVTLENSKVTIRAKAHLNSRRMVHISAELLTENGKVAVTASTNIMKAKA